MTRRRPKSPAIRLFIRQFVWLTKKIWNIHKSPYYLPCVRDSSNTSDSPHKGLVMRKKFLCHDVIMWSHLISDARPHARFMQLWFKPARCSYVCYAGYSSLRFMGCCHDNQGSYEVRVRALPKPRDNKTMILAARNLYDKTTWQMSLFQMGFMSPKNKKRLDNAYKHHLRTLGIIFKFGSTGDEVSWRLSNTKIMLIHFTHFAGI